MSGEGRRGASQPGAGTDDSGGVTLVCGATNHDSACRHLARTKRSSTKRVRAKIDEEAEPRSNTEDIYETGVYGGLGLSEAGVVVSDTIDTLESELRMDGDRSVVVCVDATPHPDESDRRQRLFRFLHALTRRVRAVGGVCHVHLGVTRSAPLVTKLEPLFDDVVTADNVTASGSTP